MDSLGLAIAALFLPLFPVSMVFNRLFALVASPWLRMVLLLAWPQAGVVTLTLLDDKPPTWILYWAVLTSALYAFRALAVRDLGLWTAYMATSAWALLWPVALFTTEDTALGLQAAGFSMPLVLLAWLAARLQSLFGAAYAGVPGGLALTAPKLAALLVLTILAVVASPVFPGFFTLLTAIVQLLPVMPGVTLAILVVWLIWAWAGALMTRGLTVGPAYTEPKPDIQLVAASLPALFLLALAISGVIASGYLL